MHRCTSIELQRTTPSRSTQPRQSEAYPSNRTKLRQENTENMKILVRLTLFCAAFLSTVQAEDLVESKNLRRLSNAKISFDLPPFAVSFNSLAYNSLRSSSHSDEVLLAAEVTEPLRLIVNSFLTDVFRDELANTENVPTILWQFVGLELETEVHHKALGPEGERRSLQTSNLMHYYFAFTGKAFYKAPADPSSAPSATIMSEILGGWIESGFTKDLGVLRSRLRDSDAEVVRAHQMLSVQARIDAGNNPFESNGDSGSFSSAFFTTLLVVGVIATLAGGFFFVQRDRRQQTKDLEEASFPSPRSKDPELDEVLPGRHGEALEIIQASDAYMAKHHPESYPRTVSPKGTSPLSVSSLGSPKTDATSPLSPARAYASASVLLKKMRSSFGSARHPTPEKDGLVRDEDTKNYSFPFKDFPRHDGTPCLIYDDDSPGDKKNDDLGLEMRASPSSGVQEEKSTPLSDDDFQRELLVQARTANSTFVIEDNCDEKVSDEAYYTRENIPYAQRSKDTRYAEARERELKLRRHSMELDLNEIEADLRPPSLSRKKSSETSPPRRIHRTVSSDSEFFSNCSNIMELEAGTRDSDDLAHATRLFQAVGNTAMMPSHVIAGESYPPLSPNVPKGKVQSFKLKPPHDPVVSSQQDRMRIPPRSPVVRKYYESDSSSISRSSNVGEEKSRAPKGSRGRSQRRSRGRHRRSHSHGSNEFCGDSNSEETTDVLTHGIAAYTNFV